MGLRRSSRRRERSECRSGDRRARLVRGWTVARMSRSRVAVLQIVSKQLTVTAAAAEFGISRRHLHRLLVRYREGGLDALEPRSRRPKTTPIATPETVRQRVIELRAQLTADGLDAGPETIRWHLEREGLRAPSTSTIRRVLHEVGLISPEPRKRPRSSYTRFEMAQPNEMWQSDFIHWRLQDGTDVEVLNWLDDHSRFLLSCTAHKPVTGDDVVTVFLGVIEEYGPPTSTLTDNGSVYTSRFTGGRNAFEYLLPIVGIRQKNGSPGHPQTQGKTERFHQTLQRWLRSEPDQRRAASPSCKPSWTSSARITTSGALIEPCIAEPRATPTALPQKPPWPATATSPVISACATTGSTPKAR